MHVLVARAQARRASILPRDADAVGGIHEAVAGAMAVDGDALCRAAD